MKTISLNPKQSANILIDFNNIGSNNIIKKKYNMKKILLFLLFSIVIFASCEKTDLKLDTVESSYNYVTTEIYDVENSYCVVKIDNYFYDLLGAENENLVTGNKVFIKYTANKSCIFISKETDIQFN